MSEFVGPVSSSPVAVASWVSANVQYTGRHVDAKQKITPGVTGLMQEYLDRQPYHYRFMKDKRDQVYGECQKHVCSNYKPVGFVFLAPFLPMIITAVVQAVFKLLWDWYTSRKEEPTPQGGGPFMMAAKELVPPDPQTLEQLEKAADFRKLLVPELRVDYSVNGFVYDIYDGDTVYYHADLGYGQMAVSQTGRLLGINAPEIRPLKSRKAGEASRDRLWELVQAYALNRYLPPEQQTWGYQLKIQSKVTHLHGFEEMGTAAKEKFGRYLVRLVGADDHGKPVELNKIMEDEGFAVPFMADEA